MWIRVLAFLLLLVISFATWLWFDYQKILMTPVVTHEVKQIEIAKGDSFSKISRKLTHQGIAIRPLWFKALAYHKKVSKRLKAGEYELFPGLTMPQILDLLVSGKVKQYTITIPEGWTFKQVLQALQDHSAIQHTLQEASYEDIMARFQAEFKHPEGWFFPDTYFFTKNTSDFEILKRGYQKMQSVLQQEWSQKVPGLPLQSPYEALILASIIEKETGASEERAEIAGVFIRRLQKKMLLQTDPTVIYGMGDSYNGNIRRQDLKTPTPYNTYVIKGLPPTPIAMPGREAIHAALHPADGDALYFVAKGNGTHTFSRSLAEHNRAVYQYQLKR